jgi:group I intron endonuclease
MKVSGIYKITNKVNKHIYVGQSSNIEARWEQHKEAMREHNASKLRSSMPLYNAAIIHGPSYWHFEIIEKCSIYLLNKRERYWIKKLDSVVWHHKGYNANYGGDMKRNKKFHKTHYLGTPLKR